MSVNLLEGSWIGDLRGTLIGNLFAEFGSAAEPKAKIRINIQGSVTILEGVVRETSGGFAAKLSGRSDAQDEPVNADIVFQIKNPNHIVGNWELSDGNAGPFGLTKSGVSDEVVTPSAEPLQFVQKTDRISKVTIFRDEIRELTASMKQLLPSQFDVVVTAMLERKQLRRLERDFWSFPSMPHRTDSLTLFLQDPPGSEERSITINLTPSDCSFTVAGRSDIWVNGAFMEVSSILNRRHSSFRAFYEKHGLNFNGAALLFAIILAPSLDLFSRVVLFAITLCLAFLYKALHSKTTALRIFLKEDRKERPFLNVQSLLTTLVGSGVIAAVGVAYGALSEGWAVRILEWLAALATK